MVIVQTDSDWLERTAEWGKKKEKEEREKEKGKREEVWRVIEIFFGVKFVGTLRTRVRKFSEGSIFGRGKFWQTSPEGEGKGTCVLDSLGSLQTFGG